MVVLGYLLLFLGLLACLVGEVRFLTAAYKRSPWCHRAMRWLDERDVSRVGDDVRSL
jgi:hypothetical protein